jgi:pimeloyl-ACP methyl ester carboxylesterase
MGGIATLAFAARNPELARAILLIDVAVVSTRRRDRHVQRLRALPTIEFERVAATRSRRETPLGERGKHRPHGNGRNGLT